MDGRWGVGPREFGNYDVGPAGKRPPDGLEGHPAHDYGMAGRCFPEIFHVPGEVPQKLVPAAYGEIVRHRDYDTLFHIAILLPGPL